MVWHVCSPGEVQSITSDSLMIMKWCDRWDVRMHSTLHSYEAEYWKLCLQNKKPIVKAKHIVDCNYTAVAVARTDMLLTCIHGLPRFAKRNKERALDTL